MTFKFIDRRFSLRQAVRYLDSGFVQIPVYRLTPAAIAMVNQTKGLSK